MTDPPATLPLRGGGSAPARLGPYAPSTPYHRLLRTSTYRPWKPLVGLGVFLAVFVLLTVGATLYGLLIEAAVTGDGFDEVSGRYGSEVSALSLLTTNLSLAAFIPAAVIAMLLVHRQHPGWLASVACRLRWALLWRCLLLALLVVVALTLVGGSLLAGSTGEADSEPLELVSFAQWASLAAVVLLTTPLQAVGEEVGFRGYPLMVLGAWIRTPWVGVVVTSVLFAFAHGAQNPALFVDRLGFGLVAGWLVVRTGGLEASIALHVVNNVVVFLIAAAVDEVDAALTTTEAPWSLAVLDIVQALLYAWLVTRVVRRREVAVRTT